MFLLRVLQRVTSSALARDAPTVSAAKQQRQKSPSWCGALLLSNCFSSSFPLFFFCTFVQCSAISLTRHTIYANSLTSNIHGKLNEQKRRGRKTYATVTVCDLLVSTTQVHHDGAQDMQRKWAQGKVFYTCEMRPKRIGLWPQQKGSTCHQTTRELQRMKCVLNDAQWVFGACVSHKRGWKFFLRKQPRTDRFPSLDEPQWCARNAKEGEEAWKNAKRMDTSI